MDDRNGPEKGLKHDLDLPEAHGQQEDERPARRQRVPVQIPLNLDTTGGAMTLLDDLPLGYQDTSASYDEEVLGAMEEDGEKEEEDGKEVHGPQYHQLSSQCSDNGAKPNIPELLNTEARINALHKAYQSKR